MFENLFNICLKISRIRISYNYACVISKKNTYGNINIWGKPVIYIKES